MDICVVGTGYVGLVAGAGFANSGNRVVCCDVDGAKIEMLERGEVPIYEPGLEDLVVRNTRDGRLRFSDDVEASIAGASVVFLAVGTPQAVDGRADLSAVLEVARTIGRIIEDYTVIVIKSTVPVGTNDRVTRAIAKLTDVPFSVVSNPEFLKEGDSVNDFMKPDRVIIGTEEDRAFEIMRRLYLPFQRRVERVLRMDPRSAELTKYVSNAYLATRISFINEMAILCEHLGCDVTKVRRGAGADSRIGTHFFYPGAGYGGSCFPKDVKALMSTADDAGFPLEIIAAVDRVNNRQKQVAYAKLRKVLGDDLSDVCVGIWGLSFKPRTDDTREAPALNLIRSLLEDGASVRVHDPAAADNVRREFGDSLVYCSSAYEAATGAAALCVMTEWQEYRSPDPDRLADIMVAPRVIVDGRNLYRDHDLGDRGLKVIGIGYSLEAQEG
jgi:UDPglucose 6-dehydrogenase